MLNIDISKDQKDKSNQIYIDDLKRILKTRDSVPTYTPRKVLDCFYLYKNGTDYRLYIYINNEWKYSTLT